MVALLGLSFCSLVVRKNDGGQELIAEVRREGREAGRWFSWLPGLRRNDAALSVVISSLLTELELLTEIEPLFFMPGTGESGMTAERRLYLSSAPYRWSMIYLR